MSFTLLNENNQGEIGERLQTKERLISYGINFLDDALVGIAPHDLILVGARSGAGKTQFCVNVARHAASAGKRVHFFALEAEQDEITRRLKFSLFAERYYQATGRKADYQRWYLGQYLPQYASIEAEVVAKFDESFPKNLHAYYKTSDFDIHTMVQEVLKIADSSDLIVVDHVHYFDLDDSRPGSENAAMKKIAKTARNLVLENGVPMILVSHIRKGFNEYYAPTMEDFHGSSDLYKIATRAITLGAGDHDPTGLTETYLHVVKNRLDSSVTRYIGRVFYNHAKGGYEPGYEIGKSYQKRDNEFEPLVLENIPGWVRPSCRRAPVLHGDGHKAPVPAYTRRPAAGQNLPYKDD